MADRRSRSAETVSGLRTRFSPKSRISQGLVSVAPWLDVVVLVLCFVFLHSRLILQPGVVVELPRAPFREGSPAGLTAVILSVGGSQQRIREEIVFFDDERFIVNKPAQMQGLRESLQRAAREQPDEVLVIQSDRRVLHGTVLEIMDMALDAGVHKVNVAARPF